MIGVEGVLILFLSFLLQEYFDNIKSRKYAIQDNISQMININKYGLVGIYCLINKCYQGKRAVDKIFLTHKRALNILPPTKKEVLINSIWRSYEIYHSLVCHRLHRLPVRMRLF